MTVRQVFYQLVTRGVIPKDEKGGYRPVQTQVLKMRREGLLPWSFIADGTRLQRKPRSYRSVKDALLQTQHTYRRNLWISQLNRVEVWLEKDALASVVMDATEPWNVALMVSRGQSSDTFCFRAAQAAQAAWDEEYIETFVFALYDADRSGRDAAKAIERKLIEYSDDAPITFELIAVTDEQIENWNLPTRPPKKKGDPPAVELDAIPPDRLTSLVDDAITGLVDEDAWEKEQVVEASERELLARITEEVA